MILKYLIDFHVIIVKNRNGRMGIPPTLYAQTGISEVSFGF